MVASDILAATPMITLAILGGGIYALTGVAGSMGRVAAAKADASSTAPKIRKVEPLHAFAGIDHSNSSRGLRAKIAGFASLGTGVGDADAVLRNFTGSTTVNSTASNAVTAAKSRTATASRKFSVSTARTGQFINSALNTAGSTLTGQAQTSTQGNYSDAVTSRLARSLGVDTKTDRETQIQLMASVGANLASALELIKRKGRKAAADFLAKKLERLSADLGGDLSGQNASRLTRRLIEGASSSENINLDRLKEGRLTESDVGSLIRQAIETDQAQFQHLATEQEQYQKQYEEALQEQKSISETAQRIQAHSRQTGGNVADILTARWQDGIGVPTEYSQEHFNWFVDGLAKNGKLSPEVAQVTKSRYNL